jgi:hypothetical protein
MFIDEHSPLRLMIDVQTRPVRAALPLGSGSQSDYPPRLRVDDRLLDTDVYGLDPRSMGGWWGRSRGASTSFTSEGSRDERRGGPHSPAGRRVDQ